MDRISHQRHRVGTDAEQQLGHDKRGVDPGADRERCVIAGGRPVVVVMVSPFMSAMIVAVLVRVIMPGVVGAGVIMVVPGMVWAGVVVPGMAGIGMVGVVGVGASIVAGSPALPAASLLARPGTPSGPRIMSRPRPNTMTGSSITRGSVGMTAIIGTIIMDVPRSFGLPLVRHRRSIAFRSGLGRIHRVTLCHSFGNAVM
jgi:hypothetical protein